MKHARPTAPRAAPPYTARALADARYLLTHVHTVADLEPGFLKASIDMAWTTLRKDRADRLPRPPKPNQTARVLRVPLAVFQDGPIRHRLHPRHRITLGPTTPGEAA
jgi:hypothetical protein